MGGDEEELLAEIDEIADYAAKEAPRRLDTFAVAMKLAERYGCGTVPEIHEKVKEAFTARGLSVFP